MKDRQRIDELAASGRDVRFWGGWGVALALGVVVVVLASAPPFVGSGLRLALMQGFSTVCHQIAERSPQMDGIPLAVCHRCYGIYWGILLAVLGFLMLTRWESVLGRHAPRILLLSLFPPGVDWLLGVVGIWHNTPLSRLLTGGLFGLVAGYYLARAFSQLFAPTATEMQRLGVPEGEG